MSLPTKETAYHTFLSGFTWKAYDESTVPDEAAIPRITYDFSVGQLEAPQMLTVSVWDRSTKWDTVTAKADEICHAIGWAGENIRFDGGIIRVMLPAEGTVYRRFPDEDDSIRRIIINLEVIFLTTF